MGYFVVGFISLIVGAAIGVTCMCLLQINDTTSEDLAKDKEFWRREAIKHASELGEIRIARYKFEKGW